MDLRHIFDSYAFGWFGIQRPRVYPRLVLGLSQDYGDGMKRNDGVAEKLSVLRTEHYFQERAGRADIVKAKRI
jgi:hypothetical protein